jgi:hypothetical protein
MRLTYKVAVVTAATIVTIAGAAVAFASVPDSAGVIHACYTSKATRIVDNPKCKSGEKALAWNQVGPQGPQGPKGDPGMPAAGAGPESRVGHCVVSIPAGKPAGDYKVGCTYKRPFTTICVEPEIVAVPATLAGLETEDRDVELWHAGVDFSYWVVGLEYNGDGCGIDFAPDFHLVIHTFHKTPKQRGVVMGFNYNATLPTR